MGLSESVHCCSGVGEVSLWEFSGYEPYHVTYDLFIGDANCISIVVVSLRDSADVQLSQIVFWLNFIKARLAPQQTFGNHSLPARDVMQFKYKSDYCQISTIFCKSEIGRIFRLISARYGFNFRSGKPSFIIRRSLAKINNASLTRI